MAKVIVVTEPHGAAGLEDHDAVDQALFVVRRPDTVIVVVPLMVDAQRAAARVRALCVQHARREHQQQGYFAAESHDNQYNRSAGRLQPPQPIAT